MWAALVETGYLLAFIFTMGTKLPAYKENNIAVYIKCLLIRNKILQNKKNVKYRMIWIWFYKTVTVFTSTHSVEMWKLIKKKQKKNRNYSDEISQKCD